MRYEDPETRWDRMGTAAAVQISQYRHILLLNFEYKHTANVFKAQVTVYIYHLCKKMKDSKFQIAAAFSRVVKVAGGFILPVRGLALH